MPASPLVESSTSSIDFAAEDAAFGVDLIERKLAADQFVLAERGVGAGQRVVEADLDGLVGQRLDHEWTGDLHGAERETGLQYGPPLDGYADKILGHHVLSLELDLGGV